MIPENAIRALADPVFRRSDASPIADVLRDLGVAPRGCFLEFFRRFTGGYDSESVGFLLLDLCEGEPSIRSQTLDARTVFPLPASCLVLTDMRGHAVLVYDCDRDAVYHVDFEGAEARLADGTLTPTWTSFASFLDEFFG